jgi:PAS domain S-box-containing protein
MIYKVKITNLLCVFIFFIVVLVLLTAVSIHYFKDKNTILNLNNSPILYKARIEGYNCRWVKILFVIKKIENYPWHIIAKADFAEILKEMHSNIKIILLIEFLPIFFTALVLFAIFKYRQKRIKQKFIEAEKKYTAFVTNFIGIAYQAVHNTFKPLFIHGTVKEITGYDRKDFISGKLTWDMLIHPDDKLRFKAETEMLDEKKKSIIDCEYRIINKNGDIVWLRDISRMIYSSNNEKIMQGEIYDITQSKIYQKKIDNLNRIYLMLSSINQVIVRIKSKKELIDEVCRIIVDIGKFKMVWIGFFDEKSSVIVPWSYYGSKDNYLDNIKISADGDLFMYGTAVKAYREGECVIINDIENDNSMKLWTSDAFQKGYESLAVFPIKVFNKIAGVINIYSEEKNFFNDQEIHLFKELSLDISFALESIEKENQRDEAIKLLDQKTREMDNFFNYSIDLLCIADINGNPIRLNPQWGKTLGYSLKELEGIQYLDFVHPDDREASIEAMKRLSIKKEVSGFVNRYICKDGSIRWLEWKSILSDNIIYIVARDITEQKEAMERIKKSEELYKRMVANSPIGMHFYRLTDEDELILIDYNPAADKILGIDHSLLIGKKIEEAFPSLSGTEIPVKYKDVATTGLVWTKEESYYKDDKITGAYDVKAFQISKNFMVATFIDITERIQAEENINKALREKDELLHSLEIKNKELENIIRVVSHDLRSPLVNIMGFSQQLSVANDELISILINSQIEEKALMSIKSIIDDKIPLALDFINKSAIKMDKLIKGLLTISRTGRMPLNIEKINMNELINEVIAVLSYQINQTEAEIIVDKLPDCYGDYNQFYQLFFNLIDNAIKYKDKNRKLIIKITALKDDKKITYIISDTGIGIPDEYKDKIWELFTRINPDSTIQGEGIGLALVNSIVHRHNGSITVKSEFGKGSSFFVEFQSKINTST